VIDQLTDKQLFICATLHPLNLHHGRELPVVVCGGSDYISAKQRKGKGKEKSCFLVELIPQGTKSISNNS
jgi:phage/plasmid primase-like uncharacterized protein